MYIGIDLGGTNIAAGLVTDDGKLLYKDSIPTQKERNPSEIIADMAMLAKRVVAEGGSNLSQIHAVGIGCPGTIDNATGSVVYSNNIVMEHIPMAKEFQKYLNLPVNMENDANAAAYGEFITNANGANSFVFITLGTGVGGGIILDGKIWRGFNGAGAELGHSTLVYNGESCTCGKKGCWEAYASVSALIAQTKLKMEQCPTSAMHQWVAKNGYVTGRTAFECAKAGDAAAIAVRDQYIEYVAEGICSVVNILQPDVLAIGGGISREGDTLLTPIRAYFEKNDFNKYMPKTDIRIATLFGDAGIIGAAMAAKKSLQKRTPKRGFCALRSARKATRPPRRKLLKKFDQNFHQTDEIVSFCPQSKRCSNRQNN